MGDLDVLRWLAGNGGSVYPAGQQRAHPGLRRRSTGFPGGVGGVGGVGGLAGLDCVGTPWMLVRVMRPIWGQPVRETRPSCACRRARTCACPAAPSPWPCCPAQARSHPSSVGQLQPGACGLLRSQVFVRSGAACAPAQALQPRPKQKKNDINIIINSKSPRLGRAQRMGSTKHAWGSTKHAWGVPSMHATGGQSAPVPQTKPMHG